MTRRESLPVRVAILALVAGVVAMLATASLAFRFLGARPSLLLAEFALAGPGLLCLAFLRVPYRESLRLQLPAGRVLGLGVLCGATLWGASLGLFEAQSLLVPPSDEFLDAFQRLHQSLAPQGILDGLASVAVIALAPACCEELLFRGVLLRSFLSSAGPIVAILGSALLFGLIHVMPIGGSLSFYRVPFACAVGLGLGLLFVSTGSLLLPIIAHSTLNTITFLGALPFAGQELDRGPDPLAPAGLPLLVLGSVAFVFLLKRLRALTSKSALA